LPARAGCSVETRIREQGAHGESQILVTLNDDSFAGYQEPSVVLAVSDRDQVFGREGNDHFSAVRTAGFDFYATATELQLVVTAAVAGQLELHAAFGDPAGKFGFVEGFEEIDESFGRRGLLNSFFGILFSGFRHAFF